MLEEVAAVLERDTVSQVMTASPSLEAVIASLTTATKEKVGLGKESRYRSASELGSQTDHQQQR